MTEIKTHNFILIEVGDKVYDQSINKEGIVQSVSDAHAVISILNSSTSYVSKRHNLVKLKKENEGSLSFNEVKEFHDKFGHPMAVSPKPIEKTRGLNRTVWTGEELVEFLHASSKNKEQFAKLFYDFKEGLDKAYLKSLNDEYIQDEGDRVVAQADALVDALYFINGSFVELGVNPEPLHSIVHESNMSKLFTEADGSKVAKYREDGKVLKSPEFFAPEARLKDEIVRQYSESIKK